MHSALDTRNPPFPAGLLDSGGGIRTRDLRVMSPTSYLTAPPRGVSHILPTPRERSTPGDELPQPLGVARREDLPVVVEVGVDVGGPRELAHPPGPLPQLALGVVAAVAAAAVVEAQVGPVRREDVRRRLAPAAVVDDEGRAVLAQQRPHWLGEP